MTLYALVGPADEIKTYSSAVDPTVQTRAGWRWLPVENSDPGVPSESQVKEGPFVTVEPTRVLKTWTIRDKTAAEKSFEKDNIRDYFNANTALRVAALVLLDESNRHAAAMDALKQAIANASTLAALKTAVAAISFPPQRTPAQMLSAFRAKLDETA